MSMNIVFILLFFLIPNQVMAVKKISHDELYLGNDANTDKTLRFNQQGLGVDPFIRYVSSRNQFIFRNDGTSTSQMISFVDAGPLRPIIRTARCDQTVNPHTCAGGNAGAWWSSVAETPGNNIPDGRSRIIFDSNVFDGIASEYSCYTTAVNASDGITCRAHDITSNHIDVQCFDAGANPTNNEDSGFFILCLFHDN